MIINVFNNKDVESLIFMSGEMFNRVKSYTKMKFYAKIMYAI